MNTHTKPYSYEHLQETEATYIEIDKVITGTS